MSDTQAQKQKKNSRRLKAKNRGLYPSIQTNYNKKPEVVNENQLKLYA